MVISLFYTDVTPGCSGLVVPAWLLLP